MKCEDCGGRMLCDKTRPGDNESVTRWRQCEKCGLRVVTKERVITVKRVRIARFDR